MDIAQLDGHIKVLKIKHYEICMCNINDVYIIDKEANWHVLSVAMNFCEV
jgi:hypothetical protein